MATANEVHEKLNISHKKIEVIKLGFNRGTLRPLKRVKENFFLIIARHTPHKNIPRILKAFYNLRRFNKSMKDLRLKIVGQYDKDIHQAIKNYVLILKLIIIAIGYIGFRKMKNLNY